MNMPKKFSFRHKVSGTSYSAEVDGHRIVVSWANGGEAVFPVAQAEENIRNGSWLLESVEPPPNIDRETIVLTLSNPHTGATVLARRDGDNFRVTYMDNTERWFRLEDFEGYLKTGHYTVIGVTLEKDMEQYVEAILARG